MRHVLFTVALSLSFVTLCVCMWMGFRLWPALVRMLVVFLGTYVGGFVVSVWIGTTYLSGKKDSPAAAGVGVAEAEPHAQGGHS